MQPRRQLRLEVGQLEDRQLFSITPTATMTQTATFFDLESFPNVATQAFLYFSAPMGTLTEVDVLVSGSFTSRFSAKNFGSSVSMIYETTHAALVINVPTGGIALSIPSITETFKATSYDSITDYVGTSNSGIQTNVFTSPASLAAFTGHFRIPITISGHATGVATSSNGDVLGTFKTQTSVTVTIIDHYVPDYSGFNQTVESQLTTSILVSPVVPISESTDTNTVVVPHMAFQNKQYRHSLFLRHLSVGHRWHHYSGEFNGQTR